MGSGFFIIFLIRYVFCCSYTHNVAPKGKFIAFVSAEAETDHPEVELKQGVALLGPVDEIFYETYDRYEPVNEPTLDNCFISTVSSLVDPHNLLFFSLLIKCVLSSYKSGIVHFFICC